MNALKPLVGKVATAIVAWACLAALTAPLAAAEFGIHSFGSEVTAGGRFSRQAGAHADVTTTLRFPETEHGTALDGNVRSIKVELPPGMVGNPKVIPTCTEAQLIGGFNEETAICPVSSQVGIVHIYNGLEDEEGLVVPVYNMRRPADLPGMFAFNFAGAITRIDAGVRGGDYRVTATVPAVSQAVRVEGSQVTLWGVPGDPSHDSDRFTNPGGFGIIPGASSEYRTPFLTNPTSCIGTPTTFAAAADSWQVQGIYYSTMVEAEPDGTPFVWTGCGRLPFKPTAVVQASSSSAASPTGVNVELTVPQSEDPGGLATAHVKKTVVTLPTGFSVDPAAAAGQQACTEAQIGLGSIEAPTCPDSSRIGTVSIKSPLLDEELEGYVYLAQQHANPFGSLLAMYLAVKGPGFYLKLPGKVETDPATGQVTTTFDNQPQLPYEDVDLTLRNGPNSPVQTPAACGSYTAKIQMTSWASSTPVDLESPMNITEGCATGGFTPSLKAGTVDPAAGSFSAFTLRVTRQDGESNLSKIKATLPPGLLAKLAGVPLCGDAQAGSGDCPAGSQVGTTVVGAGAGTSPIYVPEAGKAPTAVYLGGPYKGAPYSLIVKVPAQAGPFDLGTVVVRNALHTDPVTTQVTTESDPLPQILEGIPITYRDVRVEINRPEFTVNPTNCSQFQVASTITSASGQTASPKAPFAAANCEALGLQPKLAVKFTGAPTRRGGHPKLTATLTTKKGDANLEQVQVTLPKTEYLENAHIKTVCTRVQYAANQCPAKSIYGHARAWSPLLDQPLEGPVYLRSSSHKLPDLVASLSGQIHVDLDGRISSYKSQIRNTFETVPDAPVSKFVLTMQGGGKGLLVNNTQLCKAKPKANVVFDGQNGKTAETNPLVSVGGCGGKGKKKAKK
jgi:hypothetical protein